MAKGWATQLLQRATREHDREAGPKLVALVYQAVDRGWRYHQLETYADWDREDPEGWLMSCMAGASRNDPPGGPADPIDEVHRTGIAKARQALAEATRQANEAAISRHAEQRQAEYWLNPPTDPPAAPPTRPTTA